MYYYLLPNIVDISEDDSNLIWYSSSKDAFYIKSYSIYDEGVYTFNIGFLIINDDIHLTKSYKAWATSTIEIWVDADYIDDSAETIEENEEEESSNDPPIAAGGTISDIDAPIYTISKVSLPGVSDPNGDEFEVSFTHLSEAAKDFVSFIDEGEDGLFLAIDSISGEAPNFITTST
jgi:hypothetical protein